MAGDLVIRVPGPIVDEAVDTVLERIADQHDRVLDGNLIRTILTELLTAYVDEYLWNPNDIPLQDVVQRVQAAELERKRREKAFQLQQQVQVQIG